MKSLAIISVEINCTFFYHLIIYLKTHHVTLLFLFQGERGQEGRTGAPGPIGVGEPGQPVSGKEWSNTILMHLLW